MKDWKTEFRDKYRVHRNMPFSDDFRESIEDYIDNLLQEQREEVIEEVREWAHEYTEREILLIPEQDRVNAINHNLKLNYLSKKLKQPHTSSSLKADIYSGEDIKKLKIMPKKEK